LRPGSNQTSAHPRPAQSAQCEISQNQARKTRPPGLISTFVLTFHSDPNDQSPIANHQSKIRAIPKPVELTFRQDSLDGIRPISRDILLILFILSKTSMDCDRKSQIGNDALSP